MSDRGRVWVTPAVVAANAAVFVAMVARGVPVWEPSSEELVAWGADYGPLNLAGQWWRLLTSGFLHIGILHLGLNLYFLSQAGPMAERLVGPAGFALTYLFTLLTGSLVSVAVQPTIVSTGASGALFGLLGLLLAQTLFDWGDGTAGPRGRLRKWAAQVVGINLFLGFAAPIPVDNFGHLGGLLGGLIAGVALARPRPAGERGGRNARLAVVAAVVLAGLFVGTWWRLDRELGWAARYDAAMTRVAMAADVMRDATPGDAAGKGRYATVLEREVLPELRAAGDALNAVGVVPAAFTVRVANAREYVRLLTESADLCLRATRQSDAELMTEANQRMDDANARAARLR